MNPDGSVDLYYGPTKAYFDKSWSIGGDFEKIDR
jgi:hypothetical protein